MFPWYKKDALEIYSFIMMLTNHFQSTLPFSQEPTGTEILRWTSLAEQVSSGICAALVLVFSQIFTYRKHSISEKLP